MQGGARAPGAPLVPPPMLYGIFCYVQYVSAVSHCAFSKFGEDRPGVGTYFGYQNIVPFSFGDACISFPFSLRK